MSDRILIWKSSAAGKTAVPLRCSCMSGEDGLSTHRAARHDGRCIHSDLTRTTKRYVRRTFKRLPGTRGVTEMLDGGR